MTQSLGKNHIRNQVLKVRDSLSATHREVAEARICEYLQGLIHEHQLTSVASYQSIRSEVNLDICHRTSGVTFSFPRVEGEDLQFLTPQREQDFQTSSFGIREPLPVRSALRPLSDLQAVIVPGVAFDRRGYRLGYGRGFYDRTLATYLGLKIGVGFRAQLVQDDLPVERHDLQMDYIVTEDFIVASLKH